MSLQKKDVPQGNDGGAAKLRINSDRRFRLGDGRGSRHATCEDSLLPGLGIAPLMQQRRMAAVAI